MCDTLAHVPFVAAFHPFWLDFVAEISKRSTSDRKVGLKCVKLVTSRKKGSQGESNNEKS
jgi:hypothetical protein